MQSVFGVDGSSSHPSRASSQNSSSASSQALSSASSQALSSASSQRSWAARLALALAVTLASGVGCGSKSETAVVGVSGGSGGKAATGTGGASGGASGNKSGSGGAVVATSGGMSGSTGGNSGGAGRGPGTGGAMAASGGASGNPGGMSPMVGPCRIFPADNPWNRDVSADPTRPDSATYIAKMLPTRGLHPDWGTVTDLYGIPFTTGTGATPQPITWTESYGSTESDRLPCATGGNLFCYPIPLTAPIEGGPGAPTDSDRHVLYLDTAGAPDNCTLYELYAAMNPTGSTGSAGWRASNGAIFHLGSNDLRTAGWTSADAAGLPILPGLVRLDEVKAGAIRHAIRFTMNNSYQGYIHPAVHAAGSSDATLPPMGLRLRLKATYDTSGASGATLVILTAMKKYGIILADNGSDWYITGESNEGWAPIMDGIVSGLSKVKGSDFEVVNSGDILKDGL